MITVRKMILKIKEGERTYSTKESGLPEGPAITYYKPGDERDGKSERGKAPKRPVAGSE